MNLSHGYYTDSAYIVATQDPGPDFSSRKLVLFLMPAFQVVARQEPRRFMHLDAFANKAYACKCDDYQMYEMRREVTSITVRTLRDFDGEHPRGSDVTTCFRQPSRDGKRLEEGPIPLPAGLYDPMWHARLFLYGRPAAGSLQQFELSMSISDGSIYRDTTGLFRF